LATLDAARHAAALVYHDLLISEPDPVEWRLENDDIQDDLENAVKFLQEILSERGVPNVTEQLAERIVLSALRLLAIQAGR
jgi:hypothetical protein